METFELIVITFLASIGVSALAWMAAQLISYIVENRQKARQAQQNRIDELKRLNDQIDRISKAQERLNELLMKRMQ